MLSAGDKAPSFELPADSGKKVGLKSFPGKTVVLYFYPKDNTPGCTREAQAFAATAKKFESAGAVVLGVSKDSVTSHCNFRDKYKLNFPLLSDPDLSVHKAFGAYGEKTMYGKKILGTIRSTFVIDPKGTVTSVFPNVKVDGHADAVLAAIQGGGSSKPAKAAPAAKAAKKAAAPAKKKAAAPVKKKAASAKKR